jgi:CheY-like chemotaxis protein
VVSLKLRQAGLNVVTASDGQEALEMIRANRPDVLVTDYQMPVMSGYDLSVMLQASPATASIPILMITARGHTLSPEQIARTNIKAVMCKPFSPRHVLERVLDLLGENRCSQGESGSGASGAMAA